MIKAVLAAGLLAAGLASPVFAANADHPYQNCNRRIDNCGPTGDRTTDQLNQQQLGANPGQPGPAAGMPSNGGAGMPMGNDSGAPMGNGGTAPMGNGGGAPMGAQHP